MNKYYREVAGGEFPNLAQKFGYDVRISDHVQWGTNGMIIALAWHIEELEDRIKTLEKRLENQAF
jgi:hypothetical protein